MNVVAGVYRSIAGQLRPMAARAITQWAQAAGPSSHLSGLGSVMRPDGRVVDTVAYEIRVDTRWHSDTLVTGFGRVRVPRSEALYWCLEAGHGLRLIVEGGRELRFEAAAVPDHSGWVDISNKQHG